jgi:hypothetical protein
MKAAALILLASAVGSTACVTEISDVATFNATKDDMDLILDVRTWSEYIGDGTCTSNRDPDKCNYGHHSSMYFLENPFRSNKASVYKVDGVNTVDMAMVSALVACYGDAITTTKIMVSCHSGSRSGTFQDKLVEAGFGCDNIYNFQPGAKGLADANETMQIGAGSPGLFDWSTCPADKTGPVAETTMEDDQEASAAATRAASWSLGLTAAGLLTGLFM